MPAEGPEQTPPPVGPEVRAEKSIKKSTPEEDAAKRAERDERTKQRVAAESVDRKQEIDVEIPKIERAIDDVDFVKAKSQGNEERQDQSKDLKEQPVNEDTVEQNRSKEVQPVINADEQKETPEHLEFGRKVLETASARIDGDAKEVYEQVLNRMSAEERGQLGLMIAGWQRFICSEQNKIRKDIGRPESQIMEIGGVPDCSTSLQGTIEAIMEDVTGKKANPLDKIHEQVFEQNRQAAQRAFDRGMTGAQHAAIDKFYDVTEQYIREQKDAGRTLGPKPQTSASLVNENSDNAQFERDGTNNRLQKKLDSLLSENLVELAKDINRDKDNPSSVSIRQNGVDVTDPKKINVKENIDVVVTSKNGKSLIAFTKELGQSGLSPKDKNAKEYSARSLSVEQSLDSLHKIDSLVKQKRRLGS